MIEEMVEHNSNIRDLWPDLSPLVTNTTSHLGDTDIWPDNTETTFVIIEPQSSFIGKQIILDLWRRNDSEIAVRRLPVEESAAAEFLGKMNISYLPAVAVLNSEDQTVSILQSRDNEKSSLEKSLIDFTARKSLRRPANSRLSSLPPTESSGTLVSEDDLIRRRYTLYLNDLDKTVIFALTQEISLTPDLNEIQEKCLREFLDILIRFYPSESVIYPQLSQLHTWAEGEQNKLQVEQISQIMDPLRDVVPDWVGCRGSQEKFGGYSCGVWSLWHFLSVAQLEAEEGDPRDVLRAMVSYVRNFFGCRECSDHFLRMVKNGTTIEEEVNNYEDAVMFLWRKHNEVNLRLVGDASDDPLYPKGFFPGKRFCSKCFRGDLEEEAAIEDGDILNFMISHYSKQSLIRGSDFSTSFSNVNSNSLFFIEILLMLFI